MAYTVTKKIKGKPYHYLAENRRAGENKWKRFEIYLGEGKKPKSVLNKLAKKKLPELKRKVDSYLRATDPFYSLLSREQLDILEKIKIAYQKKKKTASKVELNSYEEWFITEFTYDTNAIEGSTLNKAQTALLLFEGRVPKDKKLREIYEAENHREAYNYVKNYRGDINKNFILKIHEIFLSKIWDEYAGRIRDMKVYISGADFVPPPPERVDKELSELLKWYNRNKKKYNPIIIVAYFHSAFESIHPFVDGNGRVGRLLINFILGKNNYPMISIHYEDRDKYIGCLREAQNGNLKPLANLIFNYVVKNNLLAPQK